MDFPLWYSQIYKNADESHSLSPVYERKTISNTQNIINIIDAPVE